MWHLSYQHRAGEEGEEQEAGDCLSSSVCLCARPSAAWRGVFFAFQLLPHFFCVRFWNPWNISRHDLVAFHAHRTQRATSVGQEQRQWRHAQRGEAREERGIWTMWMRVICVCVAGISSYALHRTRAPASPLSLSQSLPHCSWDPSHLPQCDPFPLR